jgi:hypothetical protein
MPRTIWEDLHDQIAWRRRPTFGRSGRVAWQRLEQPLVVEGASGPIHLHALKLKGVGLCDYDGTVQPPSSVAFRRANPHLGISESGRMGPLESDPAPLGGITLDRARAEFDVASTLWHAGVPSQLPVLLAVYRDSALRFPAGAHDGEPLAAVVSGIPCDTYLRADTLYTGDTRDARAEAALLAHAEWMGLKWDPHRPLPLLAKVYEAYGSALRGFSACGFFRHSGYPSNIALCAQGSGIYLTDLDSSRELARRSDRARALEVIRDAASALFYIIVFLTRPSLARRFDPAEVAASDPAGAFLRGYVPDVREALRARVAGIVYDLLARTRARAFAMPVPDGSTGALPTGGCFQERYRDATVEPWIERELLWSWLIAALFAPLSESELGARYPHGLQWSELIDTIDAYAGASVATSIDKSLAAEGDKA